MGGCSGAKRAEVQGTSDRFAEFCQAEHELDQVEPELDQVEPELDQVEPELDQAEPELDQAEHELDQVEPELDQVEQELDQVEPGAVCSGAAAQQEKEGGAWVRACGVWGVRPAIRLVSRSVPGDVLTAQPARQARASRRWDWSSCRVVAVAQALAGYAWRAAWPGMPPARR